MNLVNALGGVVVVSGLAAGSAVAETVELDFFGLGGFGLSSANEVGPNTPATLPGPSFATGQETGGGLVLDTDANTLDFSFAFEGLTGGLFDAASGIHLHLVPDDAPNPFAATGPIVFNLNSFDDPNVVNGNDPIAIGSPDGEVFGQLSFTEEQEADFLAGRYYLNIHSDAFRGGELRGNLVVPTAVPTPAALGVGLALLGGVAARRRAR